MNQIKKLCWLFLITTVFLTSCLDDIYSERNTPENPLVTEAREFFETKIFEAATRGELIQDVEISSPGEVTPQWDQAHLKSVDGINYVFVPVLAQNHYIVRERAMRDSIERHYHVPVYQLLCFRDQGSGIQSGYYLTLIPSKGYYSTNKNSVVQKYMKNKGLHGNFTGRVGYTDLTSFNLLAVDKVIDGDYEWGFSWWTVPSEESFWRNYRKMFKNIGIYLRTKTRGTDPFDDGDVEDEPVDGGEIEEVPVSGNNGSGSTGNSGGSGSLGGRGGITGSEGGSIGGGGSNNNNNNDSKDKEEKVEEKPCDSKGDANMLNSNRNWSLMQDNGLQSFLDNYRKSSVENAVSLHSTYKGYVMSDVVSQGLTNKVDPEVYHDEMYHTVASAHNHPNNTPPSFGDAVWLAFNHHASNGKTMTSYIACKNEETYAVQVENGGLAKTFGASYGKDEVKITALQTEVSQLTSDLIQSKIFTNGAEAQMYALAFVLNKYDTGIKVMKMENGKFVQKHAYKSTDGKTKFETCK